MKTYL